MRAAPKIRQLAIHLHREQMALISGSPSDQPSKIFFALLDDQLAFPSSFNRMLLQSFWIHLQPATVWTFPASILKLQTDLPDVSSGPSKRLLIS